MKNRLLKSLYCQKVDRPPIWFMRQAGRYLFEYRLLRKKSGNFLNLCYSSELIAIATLQPLKRYNLDAGIIFSDILLLPITMGLDLIFVDNVGPVFLNPIRSLSDVNKLHDILPIYDLKYVLDAIKIVVNEMNDIPLIGFCGSPWTLSVYMVEGKLTKNFIYIKKLLYSNPAILHILLKKLERNIISYLCSQIDSGAKVLMIFDTWGGILSPLEYYYFSFQYVVNIMREVNLYKKVPFIFFGRNINDFMLKYFNDNLYINCIGFDWSHDISFIFDKISKNISVQGNLDPCLLYGDNITIINEIRKLMKSCFFRNGYIFNLGHGIHPNMNPYSLELIIDTIDKYK